MKFLFVRLVPAGLTGVAMHVGAVAILGHGIPSARPAHMPGRDPLDSAVARFRRALHMGDTLALRANNGILVANLRAWEAMARVGPDLSPACETSAQVPLLAAGDREQICAQLLTAYIATGQPKRADRLVAALKRQFHLPNEGALQRWYAQQFQTWFKDVPKGRPSALQVVNTILERSSEAVTIHGSLLLHTAKLLEAAQPSDSTRVTVTAHVPEPKVYPSEPPSDTPFAPSKALTGIEFSGIYANYTRADTWYASWGADDKLYAIISDGQVETSDGTVLDIKSYDESRANHGHAIITGDPLHLDITPLPLVTAPADPYGGRYPSATLMYHGVWYTSTYTLDDLMGVCGNWCKLGPLVGFHWSTDRGRTWHAPPASVTPAHPLFGETGKDSARVKLSAAHFVDFGKGMEHSPDGKAYLIGHGGTDPKSHTNWISGDQFYLARVKPSPETINDVKAWEFYAGKDANGKARWSKSFTDIAPLIEWPGHLGNVSVTYDAPLKKYLLFTTHGWPSVGPFDTIVLEADQLTGPWRLVSYLKHFGPQIYYPNVMSKFISKDGCTMWLTFSANFSPKDLPPADPFGGGYWLTMHKIRLLGPPCGKR